MNDLDGDLADTRWYVDGVLVDRQAMDIAFTKAHTLRVEVEDARGAVDFTEKAITCAI